MAHKRFIPTLIALHCLALLSLAAEPADSLGYETKRRQILENSPDERATLILSAAQDLARDGYYAEAMELIFAMQDTAIAPDWDIELDTPSVGPDDSSGVRGPVPGVSAAGTMASGSFSGYVQSILDYEEWESLDTSIGGRVRAKLEWDPKGRLLDRVTTVLQASDRNAYVDASAKGSAWKNMLKLEGDALAERKRWRTYGDSLDRLFLQAKAEFNTRRFRKPLAIVAPVFAEMERFRHDRFGSQSYRSFGANPGLEAVSDNLLKTVLLSWDARRTDYPDFPSASNLRQGPVASGEWYGDRVALDAESEFQTYRYNRDTSLYRMRQLATRAGVLVRTLPWLKAGVRTVGESEYEDYRDSLGIVTLDTLRPVDTVLAAFRLRGTRWTVTPQLIAEWASAYSASLAASFSRARYPVLFDVDGQILQTPRYINTSADDWRFQAGLSALTKAIFFTLSLDYEVNRVPASLNYSSTGSSKGVSLNSNVFWKVQPWIEIDFTCSATRRLELAPGFLTGNINDNATASLGLTSRLP
ncbi:MAG: hypothetical protein JWP91_351 [Fibrobacteres bacterium]|nr:hypothetical protein [Fibrobacterota bacterium]